MAQRPREPPSLALLSQCPLVVSLGWRLLCTSQTALPCALPGPSTAMLVCEAPEGLRADTATPETWYPRSGPGPSLRVTLGRKNAENSTPGAQ